MPCLLKCLATRVSCSSLGSLLFGQQSNQPRTMLLTKQTQEVPAQTRSSFLSDGRPIVCLFKTAEDICEGQERGEEEALKGSWVGSPGGIVEPNIHPPRFGMNIDSSPFLSKNFIDRWRHKRGGSRRSRTIQKKKKKTMASGASS